ncbi:MAG: hypothetical protein L0219_09490 [Phycisphaerales bacterium]|nr:hypothetical protein [Phycisphaerales bacterium]
MKLPGKLLMVCALAATIVGACATIEELAPPVDQAMLSAAGPSEASTIQLERGRELYVTDCARCHSPEPVMRYTAQQWGTILPRMTKESSLSDVDRAAVEAYVMAVLASRGQRTD